MSRLWHVKIKDRKINREGCRDVRPRNEQSINLLPKILPHRIEGDQELHTTGYNGFEYTNEKLSTRRIHWCGEPSSIFYVLRYFWGITSQIMIMEFGSPHSLMCLVESSNKEVSGASEVPQSRGKLIFSGSPAAVFLLVNRSRSISVGVLSTSDN